MRIATWATLWLTATLVCAAPVADLSAQDGFVVLTTRTSPTFSYEYRWLAEDGSVTATVGRLPVGALAVQTVVGPDNRSLRVLTRGPSPHRGALFDISAAGRVTTVVAGGPIANPHMIFPGRDGELYMINDHGTSVELLRLANNQLSTVRNIPLITPAGCTIDPSTGFVVLRGFLRGPTFGYGYFFLDADTGSVTSVSTPTGYTVIGATRIGFDAASDEFVDLRQDYLNGGVTLMRFDRQQGIVSTKSLTNDRLTYAVDLVSASNRGGATKYWALLRTLYSGSYLMGLRGDGVPIRASQLSGLMGYPAKMVRMGSENIGLSLNQAPNDRTVRLSFPSEAGRSFVLAASLTGYSNGPRLADGRMVPITADAFTVMAANGGVPGVFGPTAGTLDANGEARIRVNGNALGSSASGVRVWVSALVLDPAAPGGVAEVAGPRVISMR